MGLAVPSVPVAAALGVGSAFFKVSPLSEKKGADEGSLDGDIGENDLGSMGLMGWGRGTRGETRGRMQSLEAKQRRRRRDGEE